jgi:hypothetical protein
MAVEAIVRVSPVPRLSRWVRTSVRAPANDPEEGAAKLAGSLRRQRLEQIDGEVRAHEATHLAALGAVAGGGASYSYVIGPDGERYAVGGSVPAAVSPVPGDPEATIRKAKALIQAAYAVALPSSADMRVAAEAYQMEMAAQKTLDDEAENTSGVKAQGIPEGERRQPREWFA